MHHIRLIFFSLFLGFIWYTNWRCVGKAESPEIHLTLDSLNNALIRSVDAYGRVEADPLSRVAELGYCWNTTGNPTLADSSVAIGKPAITTISGPVYGFQAGKKYYLKMYAKDSGGTVYYSNELFFVSWDGTLTDVEGHPYKGVQIGTQGWMAENLRTTRYADGSPIDLGKGSNRTYWYGSGHQYVPGFDQDIDQDGDFDDQDSLLYTRRYGLLYSWFAAANTYDPAGFPLLGGKKVRPVLRDVCPKGWRMPTVWDFQELTNTLAIQYGYAAYAHHLTATAGWADDMNGLDTYGFNLLPGAYWHEPTATHGNILGRAAFLWAFDSTNEDNASYVQIDNFDKKIISGIIGKRQHALCIRCLKEK